MRIVPSARLQARLLAIALVLGPVLVLAWAGWNRRFVSDDGFINFRVVDQILHGNGPVFNAGERVEAATSPLWLWVLVGATELIRFIPLEWLAVLLGLSLSCLGLFLAELGALRVLGLSLDEPTFVPLGAIVIIALPPFWDFATSGLETGVSFAWLGACFFALARLSCRAAPDDASRRPQIAVAGLVGLGVLVRPDFGVFVIAFLVALLLLVDGMRRRVVLLAAALALPIAYELFRMGYYAALTPNTAIAKDAASSRWDHGVHYLADLVGTYWLWLPFAALVLLIVVYEPLRGAWYRSPARVLVIVTVVASLVHALYVVRLGGDFMHGRMLLPALFALLMPVAVVPRTTVAPLATLSVVVIWGLVCAASLRVPYTADHDIEGVGDERGFYAAASGVDNPVTLADYQAGLLSTRPAGFYQLVARRWVEQGNVARFRSETPGASVLIIGTDDPSRTPFELPLNETVRLAVVEDRLNIGIFAYAAGVDVYVVDRHGLADALAARTSSEPDARPGHEKLLDDAWVIARFGDVLQPSSLGQPTAAKVAAATQALACEPLRDLFGHVTDQLTVGQFFRNMVSSVRLQRLQVDADPTVAVGEVCR